MGIKSWWRKTRRKVERGGKKAVQSIEKTGKKATRDVDRIANQSIDEIERAAKSVGNTIEREIMSVIDDVKDLANKAKREIEGAADRAKNELENVANQSKWKLEQFANDAEKAITEKLPAEIEGIIQDCIDELARAVTKEGLTKVRDMVREADTKLTWLAENKPGLVDQINALGFSAEFGPVTLAYQNFYTRIGNVADILDTYVNHPPELRREPIIKMIEALGPDTVDLGASVQVVALVVGSKELGVGGSLDSIGLGLFMELADVILEKIGVPE